MVAPAWLGEIEPATAPPWVRMGTRALGDGPWLLGGDDVEEQLAEKRRILDGHHDEVVAALDGTEDAAAELLARIAGSTAGRQGEPPGGAADRHPIDAAGRLVAEDLCLL